MGDSMSTIINATTTNGVVIQPDNSGSLVLQTNSGTTALTIDTSQNVGIGTTTTTPTNGRALIIYETTYPRLTLRNSTTGQTSTDGYGLVGVGNDLYVENAEAGNLAFTTSNTERMRIDSGGALLLATTSTASFTQTGTLYIGDRGAVDPIQIYRNSTGASGQIGFNNPNGRVGEIYTSGSSTVYATSSDYRLKENIVPMTGALDTVQALKPVTYTWKVDGSAGQGFIAHELQEVVPDCVSETKDAVDAEGNPKYQGIDTSFLVATLTAAIQEQQALIQSQAAAINDLKARVETLEAK
jgi:hypothetical protein